MLGHLTWLFLHHWGTTHPMCNCITATTPCCQKYSHNVHQHMLSNLFLNFYFLTPPVALNFTSVIESAGGLCEPRPRPAVSSETAINCSLLSAGWENFVLYSRRKEEHRRVWFESRPLGSDGSMKALLHRQITVLISVTEWRLTSCYTFSTELMIVIYFD